jgi:hypothetical protein
MPWFYVFLALYWLGERLQQRGYARLGLLCMAPLALSGLVLMLCCVAVFYESLVEAVTLSYQQPLYFPLNLIIAVLRGMTGGMFRINFLQ